METDVHSIIIRLVVARYDAPEMLPGMNDRSFLGIIQ